MGACLAHVHVYKHICARTLAYMCIFMCRGGVGVYVCLCRGGVGVHVRLCLCVNVFIHSLRMLKRVILSF